MIKNKIYIYEQKSFYMKLVLCVDHTGNMKSVSEYIKNSLNRIYKEKIEENRLRKKINNSYKNWDGYLDMALKRENRIDKIINK